jgi:DNA-binding IclR family transcriptional regulator
MAAVTRPSGASSSETVSRQTEAGAGREGRVRSLVRGLEVIDLVRGRETAVTVREIAAALALPRTSAYDIVTTLRARGWLTASGSGYVPGPRLVGERKDTAPELVRIARPLLAALRDDTGEIVQLSVFDGDQNLVVLREEGLSRIKIVFPVGTRTPVNWSASGCFLFSDLDDAELRRRLPNSIRPSPTGKAPVALNEVIREIRRFRAQGYGVKRSHVHEHVAMIASPILDGSGRCSAAVTVVVYEAGLSERRVQTLVAAARRTAAEITRRLAARS